MPALGGHFEGQKRVLRERELPSFSRTAASLIANRRAVLGAARGCISAAYCGCQSRNDIVRTRVSLALRRRAPKKARGRAQTSIPREYAFLGIEETESGFGPVRGGLSIKIVAAVWAPLPDFNPLGKYCRYGNHRQWRSIAASRPPSRRLR